MSSEISVCMIVMNNFSNDARVRKEAKTLALCDYSITVLALKDKKTLPYEEVDGVRVIRIQLNTRRWLGLSLFARIIKLSEYFGRMISAAIKLDADAYHAHDANTLPIAWIASKINKSKLIYDAHEYERGRDWSKSNLPFLFRRFYTLSEKLFTYDAEIIITVNESIATELKRIYRFKNVLVLHNCPERRDHQQFDLLRKIFPITQDRKIVLYQGLISANRGVEILIESVIEVPNAVAVIVGDGPIREQLVTWISDRGWLNKIFFTGHIPLEELYKYTQSADIGVILTQNTCLNHYYSLPNKFFQYMHAGLPIVASNFPEMARILREEKIGLTVNPASQVSITDALNILINDSDLFNEMCQNMLSASRKYNWQTESKKLLKAYKEVCYS